MFMANIIKKDVYTRRRYRVVTFVFKLTADQEKIGATMLINYADTRTWQQVAQLGVGDLVQVSIQHLRRYRTPVVTSIVRSDQIKHHKSQQELNDLFWQAVKQSQAAKQATPQPEMPSDPNLPF